MFSVLPELELFAYRKAVPEVVQPSFLNHFNLFLNLFTEAARADDFMDKVQQGHELGDQLMESYGPQNLNQTLQNKNLGTADKITPRAEEALSTQEQYKQYYQNPGAMSTAPIDENTKNFIQQSHNLSDPVVQSYIQDPSFGNRCLQKDANGKCVMWSMSDEILYGNFPDCQKVIKPRYSGAPDYRTCSSCAMDSKPPVCNLSSTTITQQDWESIPCNMRASDYVPGQIYAVCKDYYDWYRLPEGSNEEHDTPVEFTALDGPNPPAGATFRFAGSNDEDYSWKWYTTFKGSLVERIILSTDNSCGPDFNDWAQNCAVDYLEVCKPDGSGCMVVVQDGEQTGQMPGDDIMCSSTTGSMENYNICLRGDSVWINNGSGSRQATNPATRIDGSCLEVQVLNISYFYLYGAPDIKDYGYFWKSKIGFSCTNDELSAECQALINQGCVYVNHECTDSNCDCRQYTYNCGGTNQVVGYDVQYICNNEIRCMGSECKDTSYDANTDFAAMATAMEVLNMYRADSDGIRIFPGDEKECRKSPINCCKDPGVGTSIGDYVNAARSAITVYKLISGGIPATWTNFAAAFSDVLSGNVIEGLTSIFVMDVSNVGVTTAANVSVEAAMQYGCQVWTTEAGVTIVGPNAALISTLATAMTVITIALTVYSIVKFAINFLFGCKQEDMTTSYMNGLRLCHYIGTKCALKILGLCLSKKKVFCCFNSILARLIHECVRPQIGRSWGSAHDPDCSGLLPGELGSADLSVCDLREYMQYVQHKSGLTEQDIQRIEQNTRDKVQQ